MPFSAPSSLPFSMVAFSMVAFSMVAFSILLFSTLSAMPSRPSAARADGRGALSARRA